jgi:DNA-binding FadR family transcriptional regulator
MISQDRPGRSAILAGMETVVRRGAREVVFAQLHDAGRAEQVAQRLVDAITLGVLHPGERLPSEPELARRFGVALTTAREGLGILRDAGLIETRRGREGGSFVTTVEIPYESLVTSRLERLSRVELFDLAVYFSAIGEACAERAADRASQDDGTRLSAWLAGADFSTIGGARTNTGGFYLELAVLSQSTRLVREQISIQAEFGAVLFYGLVDSGTRERLRATKGDIVAAVIANDAAGAREAVSHEVDVLAESLLTEKARLDALDAEGPSAREA